DEVVVTGMRVEVARRNMPVNVSVIPREKIDEIEESAILPLISRSVPGVFVNERGVTGFGRTGGSSAGNISIRGVGGSPNSQVLVLVDGHPQYMGIFGHPLPNNYVASDLERVEIIRGPASILYGSNAMGGVLNLITRKQKEDGVSGSMRFGYGSYNTAKLMTNTGFKKGKWDFFASYNHDETAGHRENMNFRIDNGYIKAGYQLAEHIKLSADFNMADMNSLDPGREMDAVDVFQASMVRGKTSVSLLNNFEKLDGGILAYYNFGEHDFSDGWISNDENYGISLYEGFRPFESTLLTIGIDHKTYGGRGNAAFPPTYANQWLTVNETGGYLIAQQSSFRNRLILNGGIRYDTHSMFGSEWIPQGGVTFHLSNQLSLKSTASKGFRSPTIMELYLFAPNQELKPEHSNNYDLSLSYRLPQWGLSTELTVFLVRGDNIIQVIPNPAPPPPSKRFNSGSFEHSGFEWEVKYRSSVGFTADLSYSFLKMDIPKLASPEHQVFAGLNYKYGDFRFAFQANYIGGLYVMTAGMEGIN
ncbi:MAG: TonB-dependent receptor, partial [Bacteroidales bacterium]|nr:TonB-dependent receptor [Bacteroidales bacterium]